MDLFIQPNLNEVVVNSDTVKEEEVEWLLLLIYKMEEPL